MGLSPGPKDDLVSRKKSNMQIINNTLVKNSPIPK